MKPQNFSTKKITPELLEEIQNAIEGKGWGSVEIYVQDYKVVQISNRNIKKLSSLATKKDTKVS